MTQLEKLLSLGVATATSDRRARYIRITNALALVGAMVATLSFPFDLITAPPWFWLTDLVGLTVFASCWALNAGGHSTVSRILMLAGGNLVIAYSVAVLGEVSRQGTVFFALATAPFFVFDLDEPGLLVPMVALPIVCYFVCPELAPSTTQYSVGAYRVYSPIVAFAGVALANIAAARTNRRAEEALLEARARAMASARLAALGEMASGIAHEIRNPLAAISLASDRLADCKRIEDVHKLAGQTKRVITRITRIIDGLSSFARDASGEPFQSVPVAQIVADTLELCQRRFAEHRIELAVPSVPASLEVECRPVQMSQILLNLLNNAHDAAEAAPEHWVRLEVTSDAGHVEIAVTDSGAGVPDELRARIFEPFFTTKGPKRGTGLGLSVSRGLAEAHHGTLELAAHGAHTRFALRLPLRQPGSACSVEQ